MFQLSQNLQSNRAQRHSVSGFTLVEMIVAVSVFTISVLIVVGSLIALDNASRKARTERIVTDNLSAALDSMSRSMRMGTAFHCGCTAPFDTRLDCAVPMDAVGNGGASCIAFEGQGGNRAIATDQIVFRLSNGRLQRSTQGGSVSPVDTFIDMTAPEMTITNLKFFLRGSTAAIDQPVITISMRGMSGAQAKTATDFNMQTTFAPRTPNF